MHVSKWGNSLVVRLPKALVEDLGLKPGDELEIVSASTKRITIAKDERRASGGRTNASTRLAHSPGRLCVQSGRGQRAVTAFLDTNILTYAQGAGARSEVTRQMILAGGVISVQVLNEFAAVLRRKFSLEWEMIAEAIADVVEQRSILFAPSISLPTPRPSLSPTCTASASMTR